MLVGVEYYRLAGVFFLILLHISNIFIGKFDFVCSVLYITV